MDRESEKRIRHLTLLAGAFVAITFLAGAAGFFAWADAKYPWLWGYFSDRIQSPAQPDQSGLTHVMFAFVDHFEPHDQSTMDRWMKAYPDMARRFVDSDGIHPQHSWFWYFSRSGEEEKKSFLRQLSQLAFDGFGEIEIHMHHQDDSRASLAKKMEHAIRLSQEAGALKTAEAQPRTAFGFIHGLWALDNSRGGLACGVNDELILLRELGCYADFTQPSWGEMHPRITNRLYYAADDPKEPKSYDTGIPMRRGDPPAGDLLIFEGPSVVRFRGLRPVYDHGDVTHVDLPVPERIDGWVRANIHVAGRPEWVFVKVFTHGAAAADHEAVLGSEARKMHTYLSERYNDGTNYALHYVTAREAYNIAKAAEAGASGNPNDYRDFIIPPYVNRSVIASVPYDIVSLNDAGAAARLHADEGTAVTVQFRNPISAVSGDARLESIESAGGVTVVHLTITGKGTVGFHYA